MALGRRSCWDGIRFLGSVRFVSCTIGPVTNRLLTSGVAGLDQVRRNALGLFVLNESYQRLRTAQLANRKAFTKPQSLHT